MKKIICFLLTALSIIGFSAMLESCSSNKKNESVPETQMLTFETQRLTIENKARQVVLGCDVDVPVNVPTQPLLDSLKVFLNGKIHDAFEATIEASGGNQHSYLAHEDYSDDLPNLLSTYSKKYEDIIKSLPNNRYLSLFVIGQTENFVTYGSEWYHCDDAGDDSCGAEFHCYTFRKKDGHMVEVMTHENLLKFVKDHPEKYPIAAEKQENLTAGLTVKGLFVSSSNGIDGYIWFIFPYKDVMKYLSNDAQELVKNMGDNTTNRWPESFIGTRIGEVTSSDGKTIVLTEYPDYKIWFGDGPSLNQIWSNEEIKYSQLKAFYVSQAGYEPANVLEGKSCKEHDWDEHFSSNPMGYNFAFNPQDSTLYMPLVENVMMGEHNCMDRYKVYRFDGKNFVYSHDDGGFWLHPSLRNFGRIVDAWEADDMLVRVDEMRIYDDRYDDQHKASLQDTCRYRFVAWKGEKEMIDAPDIVINNGYHSPDGFIFMHHGYKYVVFESIKVSDDGDQDIRTVIDSLNIYYKNKLVSNQELISITYTNYPL